MPRAAIELSPAQDPYRQSPTARQVQILDFMRHYLSERGVPPTFRDMCHAFDISSPNGIMGHMKSMARKGLVKQVGVGRHRAYLPVVALDHCPTCGRPYPKETPRE